MFVQTEKFLEAHDGDPTDISVYGQELNERTWRMAKMNLAIHGIERQPRPALGRHLRPRPAPRRPDGLRAWPTRRSTSRTGRATSRGPALAVRRPAGRQRQLRLDPAHPLQARPRRSGRRRDGQRLDVHPTPAARARSARRSSRPTWSPAWSRCRPSCSAVTGIPVCLWFFAKDKTAGQAGLGRPDRPGALHRRPRTSATWSTAPSGRCPTRTSPRSPTPSTPGAGPRRRAKAG